MSGSLEIGHFIGLTALAIAVVHNLRPAWRVWRGDRKQVGAELRRYERRLGTDLSMSFVRSIHMLELCLMSALLMIGASMGLRYYEASHDLDTSTTQGVLGLLVLPIFLGSGLIWALLFFFSRPKKLIPGGVREYIEERAKRS